MKPTIAVLIIFGLYFAGCSVAGPDYDVEREQMFPPTAQLYDDYLVDGELTAMPSEIERAAFERRLRPMVCVLTNYGTGKESTQNCGVFLGWDLEHEDPVVICLSYDMGSGAYSDTLEISRDEIVEAYELTRNEVR